MVGHGGDTLGQLMADSGRVRSDEIQKPFNGIRISEGVVPCKGKGSHRLGHGELALPWKSIVQVRILGAVGDPTPEWRGVQQEDTLDPAEESGVHSCRGQNRQISSQRVSPNDDVTFLHALGDEIFHLLHPQLLPNDHLLKRRPRLSETPLGPWATDLLGGARSRIKVWPGQAGTDVVGRIDGIACLT